MKDTRAAEEDCCCRCGKDSVGLAVVRRASSSLLDRQLHLKVARASSLPAPSSLQSQQIVPQAPSTKLNRRLAALKASIMLPSLAVRA